MAHAAALPIITAESGLTRYLEEIRRFPMLEPQEEYMLAKSWREHGDREAAHRLVTSHLRLVAKIARLPPEARKALAGLGRQALHAYLLGVQHPSRGVYLEFRSELPGDLDGLRFSLGSQAGPEGASG